MAPALANIKAIPLPIPRDAPVTMHTFPHNEGSSDVMVQLGDLWHNNHGRLLHVLNIVISCLPWMPQDLSCLETLQKLNFINRFLILFLGFWKLMLDCINILCNVYLKEGFGLIHHQPPPPLTSLEYSSFTSDFPFINWWLIDDIFIHRIMY